MNRWSFYSICLILFIFLLLLLKFNLFPNFIDIYYHLSVASGFKKAGGFVSNAFWEYAPYGRPNLYPPFFHFLLLGLMEMNLHFMTIARLMDVIVFPLFLLTIWFFVRSFFGPRTAFFSVLMACCTYSFYLCSSNFITVTFSCIFGLLSFWGMARRKYVFASTILALSFYTHAQTPWFFIISLLLYGLWERNQLVICLKIAAFSLLLAGPFLYYLFINRHYYNPEGAYEKFLIEINLCLILSFFGIKKALRQKGISLFLIALALTAILFSFSYPYRYISGQGLIGWIVLSAVGIEEIIALKSFHRNWIFFFILLAACAPSIVFASREIRFVPFNSTFFNVLWPNEILKRPNDHCLYSRHMKEIVDIVDQNTDTGDIIYANWPLSGTIVSLMAQRADARAMLKEIKPREGKSTPLENSKLIIWFKENRAGNQLSQTVHKYNLIRIAETDMAYIYKNNASLSKVRVEKPLIPNQGIVAIFIGLLILLTADFIPFHPVSQLIGHFRKF